MTLSKIAHSVLAYVVLRFRAQLHSSAGEESSDDVSSCHPSHRQQHQQHGRSVDTETVQASKPFGALRPIDDRHAVMLRVASATLRTTAVANADDSDAAGAETILLVDRKQSMTLPTATDGDVVAVIENSPSDEWPASAATVSDAGGQSPSPRRAHPWITLPLVHAPGMTPAETDVQGATLTVDSCLVDGRPSVSSSADGHTDWTRESGSDDSPRPSASLILTADPEAHARLAVPSILPQPRDPMPTRRSRRTARAGINFRPMTAPRGTSKTTVSSSKRSTKREKKVTKTLAIVLGK